MRGDVRPYDNRPTDVPLEFVAYGEYPCSLDALTRLLEHNKGDDDQEEHEL